MRRINIYNYWSTHKCYKFFIFSYIYSIIFYKTTYRDKSVVAIYLFKKYYIKYTLIFFKFYFLFFDLKDYYI